MFRENKFNVFNGLNTFLSILLSSFLSIFLNMFAHRTRLDLKHVLQNDASLAFNCV